MEENTNLDGGQAQGGGRPTFLTVLCILTFIGSGLGVLGGLLGLVGSSALATFSPVAGGGSIIWSILALIGAGLCLFGAVQMWQLKKQGFMLYVAGSAVAILVGIINAVIATSSTSAINDFGGSFSAGASAVNSAIWTSAITSIVITIAFVLMYNANRKHLVN